ncbi:MAG: response regulator transcription factor [Verrucomicrobia bacterium]|nr:response regulator transcription factor [Verrucomicrobiota bacterium]
MRSENSAARITVGIVEDDAQVLKGLADLINQSPELVCVAACPSAESALADLPKKNPQVVLMDLQLPGASGVECIQSLKTNLPSSQFMVLTVLEDSEHVFESLAAGANGYLVKTISPAKMLEAIRELHAGGSPMSCQIARRVVQFFQRQGAAKPETDKLTDRELQVLSCAAQGMSGKAIAAKLGISVNTVSMHNRNIYEKLQVHSRVEAINKAFPRISAVR